MDPFIICLKTKPAVVQGLEAFAQFYLSTLKWWQVNK
jgi:hypothetical protein